MKHIIDPTEFIQTLEKWVTINSFSYNPKGIKDMFKTIIDWLPKKLQSELAIINDINPAVKEGCNTVLYGGSTNSNKCHILLVGHIDTVYDPTTDFPCRINNNCMTGPGCADMKGGILILLHVYQYIREHHPEIACSVLINADEEIGSPNSKHFIEKISRNHTHCLVFEPAPDSNVMIASRAGSANGSIIVIGKEAHAGRNPEDGLDAVDALAQAIIYINQLNSEYNALYCNIAQIKSDGPLNTIPGKSSAQFNVRFDDDESLELWKNDIHKIALKLSASTKCNINIRCDVHRPAKPLDDRLTSLINDIDQNRSFDEYEHQMDQYQRCL